MDSEALTLTPRPWRNYASLKRFYCPSLLHHVLPANSLLEARGPLPLLCPCFLGRNPRLAVKTPLDRQTLPPNVWLLPKSLKVCWHMP